MRVYAYSDLYLSDAMRNLGSCVDYAVNDCKYSPDLFMSLFINSGLARQFEECNPHYICGMSGIELAIEVLRETTDRREFADANPKYDRSPEFWAGWVLALAQWNLNTNFEAIQRVIPLSEVILLYNPLHEADESKFIEVVEERLTRIPAFKRINEYRKKLGLSQRELSDISGINLRTIQQYEIGAKDISKAAYKTILNLEKCLGIVPGGLGR